MKLPKIVYIYVNCYGNLIMATDYTTIKDGTVVGIYKLIDRARVRTAASLEDI